MPYGKNCFQIALFGEGQASGLGPESLTEPFKVGNQAQPSSEGEQ
jgi:hypothetical protein